MKKKSKHKRPATRRSANLPPAVRRERTITVIAGLRAGDPTVLAPQPCALANIAFELGRADRKTFLAEAAKVISTKQILGRLFSFHRKELIRGKFVKFLKVPRSKWRAEVDAAAALAKGAPAAVVLPEVGSTVAQETAG